MLQAIDAGVCSERQLLRRRGGLALHDAEIFFRVGIEAQRRQE